MTKFAIGDHVVWHSSHKDKSGVVVGIVPPHTDPRSTTLSRNATFLEVQYGAKFVYGGGGARDHESYLVIVQGKRSAKLYWPRVSLLRRAQ